MLVSLKNPPILFTTKPVYFRGRLINRLVQVAGKPGDVGLVAHGQSLYRRAERFADRPFHPFNFR